MATDKRPKPARREFGADHAEPRSRKRQPRGLLQKRPDEAPDEDNAAAAHADPPSAQGYAEPPREDRAG